MDAIDNAPLHTVALPGFRREMARIADLMADVASREVRSALQTKSLLDEMPDADPQTAFVTERMLCAQVDTMLWYLATLLRMVFALHPHQMLARDRCRDVDDPIADEPRIALAKILEADSREQLLSDIIEEKVERLSYRSLGALDAYFTKRLGLPIVADAELLGWMDECVGARNLVVHNRGIVNRFHLGRYPNTKAVLGGRVAVDPASLLKAHKIMCTLMHDLDVRVGEKFLKDLSSESNRILAELEVDLYGTESWFADGETAAKTAANEIANGANGQGSAGCCRGESASK